MVSEGIVIGPGSIANSFRLHFVNENASVNTS
jgi:hypothetical protein